MDFDVYLLNEVNLDAVTGMVVSIGGNPELLSSRKSDIGFLGLNIREYEAAYIAEAVFRCRGHATVVPTAYREPKVTRDEGLKIAAGLSEKLNRENNPDGKYEATVFHDEEPYWWRYVTPSQELQDRGIIPGARFVHIDKLDGHVWSLMERQLWYVRYYIDLVDERTIDEIRSGIAAGFQMEESTDYFNQNKPVLRSGAVMLDVTPHTHIRMVEKDHGFTPKYLIAVRVLPHARGCEDSHKFMIRLLEYFLNSNKNDLIYYIEEFSFQTIIQRRSGRLALNTRYENWEAVRTLFHSTEYELIELENYIQRRKI